MLKIDILPALRDNYIYLACRPEKKAAFVVDPGQAGPVRAALASKDVSLEAILITHHHQDHIGGIGELVKAYACPVIGPAAEASYMPVLDQGVGDQEVIHVCGAEAEVIATPGHTLGHVSYWFADSSLLFCGDTLFSLGCGRLFEGTPSQMWESLQRLGRLPEATKIYCGHEYSQAHGRFALTIEPDNLALQARVEEINRLRSEGRPTLPVTLGQEFACNPFLRAGLPAIKESLGMRGAKDVDVFATIRQRKDDFV